MRRFFQFLRDYCRSFVDDWRAYCHGQFRVAPRRNGMTVTRGRLYSQPLTDVFDRSDQVQELLKSGHLKVAAKPRLHMIHYGSNGEIKGQYTIKGENGYGLYTSW